MKQGPALSGWRAIAVPRFRWLAAICGLVLLAPWASRLLAQSDLDTAYWLVDLAAHWQWLALVFCLVMSSLVAALARRKCWLLAWLACPLPWLSASMFSPVAVLTPAPTAGETITVIATNVHYTTRQADTLRAFATSPAPADLVVVIELGVDFSQALSTWKEWPHQIRLPRGDPFGLALLSRHPITGAEQLETPGGIPRLRVRVNRQGEDMEVVLTHPMPPISAAFARERDATLAEEALRLVRTGRPGILAGDFNATPWSPAMAAPSAAGLQRASPLFPGTWPSPAAMVGIPIDHMLVTRHWQVAAREVGPDIGSDHRPVRVSLWRAAPARP